MSIATAVRQKQPVTTAKPGAITAADDFEAIYEAFHGRIFGLAYRMMGNADDALDVTQDAFISAYQNLDKLAPRQPGEAPEAIHLSAWLHRIAANKCIDALRRRKRRAGVNWDIFAQNAPACHRNDDHPEIHALESERSARIQRVLDEMSSNYRLALLLHEYQGMSLREVAEAMGRTESAVKSLLFRAREQFRSLYSLESAIERSA
ncbi:hypothetical protein BH23CHL2_BH23CHL2_04600 [soil metagenome]